MDPYVGEIRLIGFNFAPVGWLMCDGSLQSISQYTALYQLLGTTYGGDGQTTFGVPDLRGRGVVHQGSGGGTSYTLGQTGGQESVTLTSLQNAAHTHPIVANNSDNSSGTPQNSFFGTSGSLNLYQPSGSTLTPTGNMLTSAGGSQPHENRMPFLAINYIISTDGSYPPQN